MPRMAWKKWRKVEHQLPYPTTLLKPTVAYRMKMKLLTISDLYISPHVQLLVKPVVTETSGCLTLHYSRQTTAWEGIQVKLVTDSHWLASQCKPTEQPTSHGKSEVYSPFLWSVFKVIAQNKPREKGRFFECLKMSVEKKEKGGKKKSQDVTDTSWKKETFLTLAHSTLAHSASWQVTCPSSHTQKSQPVLFHISLWYLIVPSYKQFPSEDTHSSQHFPGRRTLFSPYKTSATIERDCLNPLAQAQWYVEPGYQKWMIFKYLRTGNRVTGLSQTPDFSSVTRTCSAGIFFPLFAMLFKKNMYTIVKHSS